MLPLETPAFTGCLSVDKIEVHLPQDWASVCDICKIEAQEAYGSGVASIAMVAGLSYEASRELFMRLGLTRRRGGKHPLSTNMSEMMMLLSTAGRLSAPRKWLGWNQFRGLGIIKIRHPSMMRGWYWAVAFSHECYDVVMFDPHCDLPGLRRLPLDVMVVNPERYQVIGKWIQVENFHKSNLDQ